MRGALPFIVLATLSFTGSCAHSLMLADGADVIELPTATDAVPDLATNLIEMPTAYVDGREIYAEKINLASAAATELCARQLNCPAVRVRRADMYQRADGTIWTVVRLNACGEERVYEETLAGWNDATSRLR
jgi:hypothetical protein